MYDNELHIGLAHDHIDEAAREVAALTGVELEVEDSDSGGTSYLFEKREDTEGISLVQVRRNLLGDSWAFDVDPRLHIWVQLWTVAAHVLDLGRWMAKFQRASKYPASPLAASIRPLEGTDTGRRATYGHALHYDASGAPKAAPALTGRVTFEITANFEDALAAVREALTARLEEEPRDGRATLQSDRFGRLRLESPKPGLQLEAEVHTSDPLEFGRLWDALERARLEVTPASHDIRADLEVERRWRFDK